MADFTGKTVLITGGTKGIGRCAAQAFAARGANIVANYASDKSSADSLVAELGKDRCLAVQGDAGDVAACEALVASAVQAFGKIDILIPNAAMMPMRDLESITEADWDATFRLNVKGPMFLAQKAVPHMPEGSNIIFVSTSLAHASIVTPAYLVYVPTKGAIEQMVRVLAKDLARKGISVNAVAPGPTATEFFMRGKPEQLVKTIAGFSPFNKLGQPDQIADAMVFLGSQQSTWVSGQTLRVNGAMA